jgi:hypothetical protein
MRLAWSPAPNGGLFRAGILDTGPLPRRSDRPDLPPGGAEDVMIIALVDFYSLSEHKSTKIAIMAGRNGADY